MLCLAENCDFFADRCLGDMKRTFNMVGGSGVGKGAVVPVQMCHPTSIHVGSWLEIRLNVNRPGGVGETVENRNSVTKVACVISGFRREVD